MIDHHQQQQHLLEGVPIFIDTHRQKRFLIPIRPAPSSSTLDETLLLFDDNNIHKTNETHTTHVNDISDNNQDNLQQNKKIVNNNFRTTTALLVGGLPAAMSIPEMLHLLFYESPENDDDDDDDDNEAEHDLADSNNNQDFIVSKKQGANNNTNKKRKQHPDQNINTSKNNNNISSTTIPTTPNLFFHFLSSVRVCFGAERGTISFLITFFNDEDVRISKNTNVPDEVQEQEEEEQKEHTQEKRRNTSTILQYAYSNAAREFFHRWHGRNAFSLAKEIITVDYVDMNELIKREERKMELFEKQRELNHHQHFSGGNNNNNNASNNIDIIENNSSNKNKIRSDDSSSLASSWWKFFEHSFHHQRNSEIEKNTNNSSKSNNNNEEEPCPICLDNFNYSLDLFSSSSSSGKTDESPSATLGSGSVDDIDYESSTNSTSSDKFYSLLSDFSPSLELPCQHSIHANCFASVSGDAPCPLCRFNCCEEALAVSCAICSSRPKKRMTMTNQHSSSSGEQQHEDRNNNNNTNTPTTNQLLWMCLVCGESFCSQHQEEEEEEEEAEDDVKNDSGIVTDSSKNKNHKKQKNTKKLVLVDHRKDHFLKHHQQHHLFLQNGGLRLWDCAVDDFVHRTVLSLTEDITRADTRTENEENHEGQQQTEKNPSTSPTTLPPPPTSWAEDEDEIQAAKLESQMETMENFYNDLLLEQLQVQEDYYSKKAENEGILEVYEKVSMEESSDRSVIVARWMQELKLMVHNNVVMEMRSRAKMLRQKEHKVIKEELEVYEVMLATANATRDKYKKFLGAVGGTNSSSSTAAASASSSATSTKTKTTNNNSNNSINNNTKPQTLEEVPKFVDKHPEVVALEKELEKLINQMTAM